MEARLRDPLAMRDICTALAAVNSHGILVLDQGKLVFSSRNNLQSFQLWVELTGASMLDHVTSLENFAIEIHYESFHRMFRSYNPMCEAFMRVSERGSVQRLVAIRMSSDAEGPEMIVRQRINALAKPLAEVPTETVIGDLDMCCELALGQLAQIVRVADKYRQLETKLEIRLGTDHMLTVISHPEGVEIHTSWSVAFPEILAGSQDSIVHLTPRHQFSSLGSPSSASVGILARDWHVAMVHCQQLARRVVLGLVNGQVLAVFCYPYADNDENVLTFYLTAV